MPVGSLATLDARYGHELYMRVVPLYRRLKRTPTVQVGLDVRRYLDTWVGSDSSDLDDLQPVW